MRCVPTTVSLTCAIVTLTSPSELISGTTSSFSTTSMNSVVLVIWPLLLFSDEVVELGYGIRCPEVMTAFLLFNANTAGRERTLN